MHVRRPSVLGQQSKSIDQNEDIVHPGVRFTTAGGSSASTSRHFVRGFKRCPTLQAIHDNALLPHCWFTPVASRCRNVLNDKSIKTRCWETRWRRPVNTSIIPLGKPIG